MKPSGSNPWWLFYWGDLCAKKTNEAMQASGLSKADCREFEKYDRKPEDRKRYGSKWRRIRRAYVTEHPVCEMCLLEHRATPVEEVHHIYPLDHGGTNDFINLMSLCKSCHSRITVLMGDRWNKREYKY